MLLLGSYGLAPGATPHLTRVARPRASPQALFTGIVTDVGVVTRTSEGRLAVRCESHGLAPGRSIAVNGVCLTVASGDDDSFWADVTPTTRATTTLGRLSRGELVNLEPPLRLGDDLSGHLVQGHVDGVGVVSDNGDLLTVRVPPSLAHSLVERGSVCVDGASLTVAEVGDDMFSCALIPETRKRTTLGRKRRGDGVNVEVDVVGKYIRRVCACQRCAAAAGS